jgi:hypothetical protein
MRLTDDQLRDVLARAEEIQRESRYGDDISVDLETVLRLRITMVHLDAGAAQTPADYYERFSR